MQQQIVSLVNRLPETGEKPSELGGASGALQRVLRRLASLREDLRVERAVGGGRRGATGRSDDPVDNATASDVDEGESGDGADGGGVLLGGPADDEVDDDDEADREGGEAAGGDSARLRRLAAVWDGIDRGVARCRPFWEDTLATWQRRAQVCSRPVSIAHTQLPHFFVFNFSLA